MKKFYSHLKQFLSKPNLDIITNEHLDIETFGYQNRDSVFEYLIKIYPRFSNSCAAKVEKRLTFERVN